MVDMSRHLIEVKMRGQFGLLPRRWVAQLVEIRALPEAKETER